MEPTFRKSMSLVHTWVGVIICAVLFAVFWMGTLSVFDREIDRWMMPMTRLPAAAALAPLSLDATARPVLQAQAPASSQWTITRPTERAPTLRLGWRDGKDRNVNRHFDPASGNALPDAGTYAGTGFIYPFHYRLHLRFMDIGEWLVGLAAMGMLLAIVTGVVIHKKIFREFFTFRPRSKTTLRGALDLHNLTGVLALPFHFFIGLSGLVIFFTTYFPAGWQAAYGDRQAFNRDANQTFQRARANAPGTLASLDAMTAQAQRLWGDGQAAQVRVHHPGDASSYVEVRRSYDDGVARDTRVVYFDAASGGLLARAGAHRPAKGTQEFVEGLHMIQFRHWTLRWLYFICGLAGCIMIATGFLVWIEQRQAQHQKQGLSGARIVQALAVGAVPGIVVSTFAFFVTNRLLPLDATFAGAERAALEMWAFYLVWILCFAHATWRGRQAWAEQSLAVAVLALLAVALNWITTGDHPGRSLISGQHRVAAMDLLLLAGAGIAWMSARKLHRRTTAVRIGHPRLEEQFS
jgi:uncharacterized iron-regulated membrane protein